MFYISDVSDEIRRLLNDAVTPYRFSNELILQFASEAVREIYRLRPDSKITSAGVMATTPVQLYKYTVSSYMKNYFNIRGWDRYTYPTLYFIMYTTNTVARVYYTSAARTGDTAEIASISGCSTPGVKSVVALNSSGLSGNVYMLSATNGTTWDVSATENLIQLDDIFRIPLIHYVCYQCFSIDSEDTADNNLSTQFYQKFMGGM